MRVPLVDLGAQFQALRPEIMAAIENAIGSSALFLGPNTEAFEHEFAEYCGTSRAAAVANGTDALHLVLRAAGVGPGDEVITVSHTFIATIEAIDQVGARPVLVDIDPRTFTIDVDQAARQVTPRTKAIIPVHLYGRLADMDGIMALAHARNLLVIEDASQAHGAVDRSGRRAGSIGHAGTFSFYYAKNLGAYGEAGAVVTSDPELDRQIRLFRTHGEETRYHHSVLGFNSRPDEVQCAVLRVKLHYLEAWNAQRQMHAARYHEVLGVLPLSLPELVTTGEHVYHQYVVRTPHRDSLRAALGEAGIGSGIHYPVPVHLQPACRHLGYVEGDLPITEQVAREILSLPMYPELSFEQVQYVANEIRSALLRDGSRG